MDDRLPTDAVEPFVAQNGAIDVDVIARPSAAMLTAHAADFEDIGEVRVEVNRQRRLNWMRRMVRDPDALDAVAVPQRSASEDVQRSARHQQMIAADDVGVRQIGGQHGVVRADGRAQEEWAPAAEHQLEARQESSAGVIEPLIPSLDGKDVPVEVEYAERVAMLQYASWPRTVVGVGHDGVVFFQVDDVAHGTAALRDQPRSGRDQLPIHIHVL